jgi:hypothetical protein
MSKVFVLLSMIALFSSCHRNSLNIDVSHIELKLPIKRLDQDIFAVTPENAAQMTTQLKQSYGTFFDAYTKNVIAIGELSDPMFPTYLNSFLSDSMRIATRKQIDSVFTDLNKIQHNIEEGFKHYSYYFPQKKIPTILTINSGFNQSIVLTSDAIGISLDNYLGSDCLFYKRLGIAAFKRELMTKSKIATDVLYAWGVSEFEYAETTNNLISQMIYQGKMFYFLEAMFPQEPEELIIGFLPEKLDWCKKNESQMWTYLIEHKLLFNAERMNSVRLLNPAPFTSIFSPDSPGRTGIWIGWQIVRAYMTKHSNITLPMLMADADYQKILNESGYSPE